MSCENSSVFNDAASVKREELFIWMTLSFYLSPQGSALVDPQTRIMRTVQVGSDGSPCRPTPLPVASLTGRARIVRDCVR